MKSREKFRKIKVNIILSSKVNRLILIHLNKKGFDYAVNVSRGITTSPSECLKRFKELKEEELVEPIDNKGKKYYPFVSKSKKRKYFKLTNKGKKIVELLLQIKEVLNT